MVEPFMKLLTGSEPAGHSVIEAPALTSLSFVIIQHNII